MISPSNATAVSWSRGLRIALLILISVVIPSCSFSSREHSFFSSPAKEWAALEPFQAGKILEEIANRTSKAPALRVKASVTARGSLGQENFEQVLVAKRPASLRLEIFIPGIHTLRMLVGVNEGTVTVLDVPNSTAFSGDDSAEFFEKFFYEQTNAAEIIDWSLGEFALEPKSIKSVAGWSHKNRVQLDVLTKDSRSFRLDISNAPNDSLHLNRLVSFERGTSRVLRSTTFSRTETGEVTGLVVSVPARDIEVEIKYLLIERIAHAENLPEQLFYIRKPSRYIAKPLAELSQ